MHQDTVLHNRFIYTAGHPSPELLIDYALFLQDFQRPMVNNHRPMVKNCRPVYSMPRKGFHS